MGRVLVALVVLLAGQTAAAQDERRVEVPLRLDHAFVQQALMEQVYGGQPGPTVLWDDGKGCAFLKLWDPVVSSAGDQEHIVSRGEARAGTALGSVCLSPMRWDGFLELLERPRLDAAVE